MLECLIRRQGHVYRVDLHVEPADLADKHAHRHRLGDLLVPCHLARTPGQTIIGKHADVAPLADVNGR